MSGVAVSPAVAVIDAARPRRPAFFSSISTWCAHHRRSPTIGPAGREGANPPVSPVPSLRLSWLFRRAIAPAVRRWSRKALALPCLAQPCPARPCRALPCPAVPCLAKLWWWPCTVICGVRFADRLQEEQSACAPRATNTGPPSKLSTPASKLMTTCFVSGGKFLNRRACGSGGCTGSRWGDIRKT